MNSGDTAWVLTSAGLVLFMVPGLALFYGGMVSSRNVLVMLQQNIIPLGLISIVWALVGYSLAFGNDLGGGLLGDLNTFGLRHLDSSPAPNMHVVVEGVAIPTLAFVAYMMMFAIITPALVTGATADRLKFAGYTVFLGLWSVIVYAPVAHWLWSPRLADQARGSGLGGRTRGARRRRGGGPRALARHRPAATVAERRTPRIRSRWSCSAQGSSGSGGSGSTRRRAAGQRRGGAGADQHTTRRGRGDARVAPGRASTEGHATVLGAVTGAVGGLATITPCAGYVTSYSAIIIGALAGLICHLALRLKIFMRLDDALDVIAVHFIGGVLGRSCSGSSGARRSTRSARTASSTAAARSARGAGAGGRGRGRVLVRRDMADRDGCREDDRTSRRASGRGRPRSLTTGDVRLCVRPRRRNDAGDGP